jgi:hypothetical protein
MQVSLIAQITALLGPLRVCCETRVLQYWITMHDILNISQVKSSTVSGIGSGVVKLLHGNTWPFWKLLKPCISNDASACCNGSLRNLIVSPGRTILLQLPLESLVEDIPCHMQSCHAHNLVLEPLVWNLVQGMKALK